MKSVSAGNATLLPSYAPVHPGVPMIVLRVIPQGGTCAHDVTQVPRITIYRDGSVLMTEDDDFYCQPLPQMFTGHVDPAWAEAELNQYFASPTAAPRMITMGADVGVADGTLTDLAYFAADGSSHRFAAIELGRHDLSLSATQARARADFRTLLEDLRSKITQGAPWEPTSVRIVRPDESVPDSHDPPIDWPSRPSAAVEAVVKGHDGSCAVLMGSEATAVLKGLGARAALATWVVDGRRERIAVGLVVPGLDGCATR